MGLNWYIAAIPRVGQRNLWEGLLVRKFLRIHPSTHSSVTPADSTGSMQHHLHHFLLKVGVYELDKAGKTLFARREAKSGPFGRQGSRCRRSGAVLFTGLMRRDLCSFMASQQFGSSYAVVNAADHGTSEFIHPGSFRKEFDRCLLTLLEPPTIMVLRRGKLEIRVS